MVIEPGNEAISTREKLLDAAERLFLEKGYDGVSVRDITEEAGVNVAAVNYHFSGKRNLYREFFRRKLSEGTQRKIAALGGVLNDGESPDLAELIRRFVVLFLDDMFSSRDAEKFLIIFISEMSEKGIANDILFTEGVAPVHRLFMNAMLQALPDMPEWKAAFCISSIIGQMFHFVRAREVVSRIIGREYDREFLNEIVEHITEFSLKGMGKWE